MKNTSFKFSALAILLLAIITFSAFTVLKSKPEAAKRSTTWYFTGTSSQILNASKWRNTGSVPNDCGAIGDSPCSISVDASDSEALEVYFSDKSTGDILSMSSSRRP